MIKTLATDLDGTLFYPKRVLRLISSRNKRFLSRFLKDDDHRLILVSGRNYSIAKEMEKKLKKPVSMIACNGAALYQDEKIVSEDYLTHEEVKNIYEINKKEKDLKIWLFMTNKYPLIIVMRNVTHCFTFFAKIGMKLNFKYSEKYLLGEDKLEMALKDKDCHFYKVMPCFGFKKKAQDRARDYSEYFVKEYGEKYEAMWSGTSVEFMKKGVNKANALKKLLAMLELNETETAVAGDSGNDIPLFEAFEESFAMSQAPKEVKEKAKYIIYGVHNIESYVNLKEGETK